MVSVATVVRLRLRAREFITKLRRRARSTGNALNAYRTGGDPMWLQWVPDHLVRRYKDMQYQRKLGYHWREISKGRRNRIHGGNPAINTSGGNALYMPFHDPSPDAKTSRASFMASTAYIEFPARRPGMPPSKRRKSMIEQLLDRDLVQRPMWSRGAGPEGVYNLIRQLPLEILRLIDSIVKGRISYRWAYSITGYSSTGQWDGRRYVPLDGRHHRY